MTAPLSFSTMAVMTQQIAQNTVWTTGTKIRLTDDVQVAPDVTLTIQPGVQIDGNGFGLSAYGSIYAKGSINDPIFFHNTKIGLSSNRAYNGYFDIDYAQIDGGTIERASGGGLYGHFLLTNSIVTSLSDMIYAWYPVGQTRIAGNIFLDSPGITLGADSRYAANSIVVENNIFDRYASPFIPDYQRYAITSFAGYGNVKPLSRGNAFLDAGSRSLVVQSDSGELVSQGDYFGTTDPAVIASMVYDRNDDFRISHTIDTSSAIASPSPGLPRRLFSFASVQLPEDVVTTAQLLGTDDASLTGNDLGNLLQGNSGNNVIRGGRGDDTILGGAGNDVIYGGAGANVLSGGSGTDTAVFDFRLADADVSIADGTIAITAGNVSNLLTGFERYQFSDRTIVTGDGSPLVDDLFYLAANRDVLAAGLDADDHYANEGWRQGRDPNPLFSTSGYLAANRDVRQAGIDPLEHYDQFGWKEGRDPSAAFDNELYLARNPDVKAAGIDPLAHYLQFGQAEGRQIYAAIGKASDLGTHPGFDAEYYLLSNPDVAGAATAAGGDTFAFAYQHWTEFGWKEGRNPNAVFDTNGYLDAYRDVKAAGVDPLMHYDQFGWKEGRDPSKSFDTTSYLAAYGDVAQAKFDPMLHYLQSGAIEGRPTFGDTMFGYGSQG